MLVGLKQEIHRIQGLVILSCWTKYIGSFLGLLTFVLWFVFSISYSGKLSREKTFANFAVLWLFTKVFYAKFGGVVSFGAAQQAFRESFLHENCLFHQFAKVFSLESFPLYSIAFNGEDLGTLDVVDVRWTSGGREVDVRWRGPHSNTWNNILDFIIEHCY